MVMMTRLAMTLTVIFIPEKKDDDDRHFILKKRMTVTVIASSLILKSVIKVVEMRSRLKRRI